MLDFLKWNDLELKVCGNSVIDINLMKAVAEYGGSYSPSSDQIKVYGEQNKAGILCLRSVGRSVVRGIFT